MTKRAVLLALVALILPACGHTDRPEGVVERWLISLNQGKAGRPGTYAPESLSEQIVPGWRTKDPGQLDVIEVGRAWRGGPVDCPTGLTNPCILPRAEVPFRIKRTDGTSESGVVDVSDSTGDWRIIAIRNRSNSSLLVPSQGGQRIGDAGIEAWLAALGVAFLLVLLAAGLMGTVGRRQTPVL